MKDESIYTKIGKDIRSEELKEFKNEIKVLDNDMKRKLNTVERYLYKHIYRAGNTTSESIENYIDSKADTLIELLRQSSDRLENSNRISKFILMAVVTSIVISLASLTVMVSILLNIK